MSLCRFLLEALDDLDSSLKKLNSRLFVIRGQPTDVFPRLFKVCAPAHLLSVLSVLQILNHTNTTDSWPKDPLDTRIIFGNKASELLTTVSVHSEQQLCEGHTHAWDYHPLSEWFKACYLAMDVGPPWNINHIKRIRKSPYIGKIHIFHSQYRCNHKVLHCVWSDRPHTINTNSILQSYFKIFRFSLSDIPYHRPTDTYVAQSLCLPELFTCT